MRISLFAASAAGNGTWVTGPARNTWFPNPSSMKKTLVKAMGTLSSFLWTTIWITRMTPTTDATAAPETPRKKPRLALAIATALGVGYIPKAPGTFGSLAGIAVAILTHPVSLIMIIWPLFFSGIGGLGLDVPVIHGDPAAGVLFDP